MPTTTTAAIIIEPFLDFLWGIYWHTSLVLCISCQLTLLNQIQASPFVQSLALKWLVQFLAISQSSRIRCCDLVPVCQGMSLAYSITPLLNLLTLLQFITSLNLKMNVRVTSFRKVLEGALILLIFSVNSIKLAFRADPFKLFERALFNTLMLHSSNLKLHLVLLRFNSFR